MQALLLEVPSAKELVLKTELNRPKLLTIKTTTYSWTWLGFHVYTFEACGGPYTLDPRKEIILQSIGSMNVASNFPTGRHRVEIALDLQRLIGLNPTLLIQYKEFSCKPSSFWRHSFDIFWDSCKVCKIFEQAFFILLEDGLYMHGELFIGKQRLYDFQPGLREPIVLQPQHRIAIEYICWVLEDKLVESQITADQVLACAGF